MLVGKDGPRILKEHEIPEEFLGCRGCELGDRSRMIWGEGNPSAPLFVILDNPGARENKEGTPYLCGTRETMQKAALEAGLDLESLYVTYLLKCRPTRAYDKEGARHACMKHLWHQIEKVVPTAIMCLGDVVCQCFFEDPELRVRNLRGSVHRVKGFAVVTSYHPLAVRRRPTLWGIFLEDWHLVAGLLSPF